MKEIEILAHAKINLSLDVIRKRPDGYHDIKMIMQSISLADRVLVRKTEGAAKISSNVNNIPLNENNIALKAWQLMKERFFLPGAVIIHLHKEIPVEAGLAGGSTNAAAVLKAVNQIFELGLTDIELAELGVKIGADVPFCIHGGTALAEGIGEIITLLPSLPGLWLVLVNPGFGVSTAQVYQRLALEQISCRPDTDAMVRAISKGETNKIGPLMGNVLENVTIKMYPVIKDIKTEFQNAGLHSLMSGSGPTVFGIASTQEKAVQAADFFKTKWRTVVVAHTV